MITFFNLTLVLLIFASVYFLVILPSLKKKKHEELIETLIDEAAFEAVVLFKQAYRIKDNGNAEYYINKVNELVQSTGSPIRVVNSNSIHEILPGAKSYDWDVFSVQIQPQKENIDYGSIPVFYVINVDATFVAYRSLADILTLANIEPYMGNWYHNEFKIVDSNDYLEERSKK